MGSPTGEVFLGQVAEGRGVQWWERHYVAEKNTFIHINPPLQDTPEGWKAMRRKISDPLFSSSSSRLASIGGSTLEICGDSTLTVLDHLIFGDLDDDRDRTDGLLSQDKAASDIEREMSDTDGGLNIVPARKNGRLNKSKRLRNQKVVQQFKQQIQTDPEGFDPGTVQWPPSVMSNDKLRAALTEELRTYRMIARQRRRQDPGAHSSVPASSASFSCSRGAHQPISPCSAASCSSSRRPGDQPAFFFGAGSAPATASHSPPRDTRPRLRIPAPKKKLSL